MDENEKMRAGIVSVFFAGFVSLVCCLNQSSSKDAVHRAGTREP